MGKEKAVNKFYAICPFCHKSIIAEENLSGGYACPVCGQALGIPYLQENNLIIDLEEVTEAYELGQEYFKNTDFREALRYFNKVLKLDANNFKAYYYAKLCELYENEDDPGFDSASAMVDALTGSIGKTDMAQASPMEKIDFLCTVLNQGYIIFLNRFNLLFEKYEKTAMWDELRTYNLEIAEAVKRVIDIGDEKLMTFNADIKKHLVSICDLAMCSCQKVVDPHLLRDKRILDTPTDYEYRKAKELYGTFYYYTTALDPNYNFINFKIDYTGNLLYNESVTCKIDRYNLGNKSLSKKYLSSPGSDLSTVVSDCELAIKYSYHTCMKGLYMSVRDESRMALINDSIRFCFETLKPRISINDQKKVVIDIKTITRASEITVYLNAFMGEFGEYNKRLSADYLNRFYDELHEMIKLYYSIVYNSYNRFVNKLKQLQNTEFKYYKNFLYQITCCCALALTKLISYDQHKLGTRMKILKLGKEVSEEFLLLSDYKIEEIEQSPKYSDILDAFNYFDDSLEELTAKK